MKTRIFYLLWIICGFSCNTENSSSFHVRELSMRFGYSLNDEKYKAAIFLINNLDNSCYNPILNNYENPFINCLTDQDIKYLKDNIEQAFLSSRINKNKIPFNIFLEYVLPHNIANENLENWRTLVLRDFSSLQDTIENLSIKESVSRINNELKTFFRFSNGELSSVKLNWTDLKRIGKGDCWSMAKIAVFSCRAFGLPVTIDFTPGWANINGSHAWNSLVINDSSSIPFMGAEANPGVYEPLGLYGGSKKTAKVFRKTYSIQNSKLLSTTEKNEFIPFPFIDPKVIDVTNQYIQTSDIEIDLPFSDSDPSFFYLCIYNNGRWIPVDWSESTSNKLLFEDLGKDIVYLLGKYENETVIPISVPMVLQNNREIHELEVNYHNTIDMEITTLQPVELDVLNLAGQNLNSEELALKISDLWKGKGRSIPRQGMRYTLYYWDNSWKLHETVTVDQELLIFRNVPSNSLYKLVDTSTYLSKLDTERPFVYKDSRQVWY